MTSCAAESSDCSRNGRRRRDLCDVHYARVRRHGSPTVTLRQRGRGAAAVRWQEKYVEEPGPLETPCWVWTGGTSHGYGAYNGDEFTTRLAHRYVYQVLVRPLRDDEELDHLCRRHLCIRPDHLDPVPHKINVERGEAGIANRDKTHCDSGHEFTPENTYDNHGGRGCKQCRRDAVRASMRRKRGTAEEAVHNRDKTHCRSDHEYTPENTRVDKRGKRICKTCERATQLRYLERKAARQAAGT